MDDENGPKRRNRRNLPRCAYDGSAGKADGPGAKVGAMIRQTVAARRAGATRRVCPRPMRWSQARTFLSSGSGAPLIFTTEYPRTTLPGEAMSDFVALVARSDGLDLSVETRYGVRSSLNTVIDADEHASGCALLGSSLIDYSSDFALAAMPSGTTPISKKETEGLRRLFFQRLQSLGMHLLAMLPMPPTGLWSMRQIDDVSSLNGLRLRSYDTLSRDVFNGCGCEARHMPFSELPGALAAGMLDAVLSSGDGGADDVLSAHFKHYLHIDYSRPYIFIVVRSSTFLRLSEQARKTLTWAGGEVQRRYTVAGAQLKREEGTLAAITGRGVHVTRELSPGLDRTLKQKMRALRRDLLAQHGARSRLEDKESAD